MLAAALMLAAAVPARAVERDKGTHGAVNDGPAFYPLPPIVLPVIERNEVTRQVGVLLTIELAEGHAVTEVEGKERQLTDAFITELYRIYAWRSGADRIVNDQLLKRRLQAVADHVLGPQVAHAILIRQLVEQQR